MAFDAHKNLAYSTVLTAPSPATSGTSLVLASGGGALLPAAPFNAVLWPTGANPLTSNAEIVRVTAIAADTLTITRTQEGTSARTVVAGDQFANAMSAKVFTDIEAATQFVDFTKDLGVSRRSGTFDLTGLSGLTVGKNATVVQTGQPIATKGNSTDEFEMDAIQLTGFVLNSTTLRIFWQAPSTVVGTYAFAYQLAA